MQKPIQGVKQKVFYSLEKFGIVVNSGYAVLNLL